MVDSLPVEPVEPQWALVDYDSILEMKDGRRFSLVSIPQPFKAVIRNALRESQVRHLP